MIAFLFNQSYCQTNLVFNPSFETHTLCPTSQSQIVKAVGWSDFSTSPDYFNACGTGGAGVPGNVWGYQFASTGNAYAGFIAYADSNWYFGREIIAGTLLAPLTVSQKYYVSFMVSRGTNSIGVGHSTNKIGVKLTKTNSYTLTPAFNATLLANNTAHYYDNTVITDTTNWIKIKGSFIADSAYTYIMIGNFFKNGNTTITTESSGPYAYYFVDDVCLSTDSAFAFNYITGIETDQMNNEIRTFPNPVSDHLMVDLPDHIQNCDLHIINLFGQVVMTSSVRHHSKINVSNFTDGLYYIRILSDNRIYLDKIVIRH
jgi:hypothetical protein